ncbi:MAG: hypothetical protein ACRDAM_00925, partial [Casimicrobium sp.]
LSWSQQAAYERGSFTTLLGLRLNNHGDDDGNAELIAIGDSLAVQIRSGERIASFPFDRAEQFDVAPRLLSTLPAANNVLTNADGLLTIRTTWPLQPDDQILLVTDAVGHWLLSQPGAVAALLEMKTANEFQELVMAQRQLGRMHLDDSTLLRILVECSTRE